MVRAVYQTGRQHYKVFAEANEVVTARKNINNVMRSLAMYYPEEFATIRKKVRTKVDRNEDGSWMLTVYAPLPGEIVMGRPPGQNTSSTWIGSAYTPKVDTEYQHTELIRDEDTYTAFIHKVLALPGEVKMVTADFLQDIDAEIIAKDPTFEGWIPRLNGPTTLILERP